MGTEAAVGTYDDALSMARRAQQHLDMAEYVQAKSLAVRAEELARSDGDQRALATALSVITGCLHRLDDYVASMEVGMQAIRLWHELDDPAQESMTRTIIARVLILTGDLAAALDEGHTALVMADMSGELRPRMAALTAVGVVHFSLGQYPVAMEYCELAAETARLLGDVVAHGAVIDTIACIYFAMAEAARSAGDEAGALAYNDSVIDGARTAMETARSAGHRYYEANALGNLAEAIAFAGRPAEAIAVLESFRLDPALDAVSTMAQHLDTRGTICMALERYDQAAALFAQALELSPPNNAAMGYCEHLSAAYESIGDLRAALDYHKRFHHLYTLVASEAAQRSAGVAAIRMETERAKEQAEQLGTSNLELTLLAENLRRQSLEDPLTGLANRRFLDRLLETGEQKYAIAMIDVDHFKRVNDGFSHQIGDDVLRHLGRLLRGSCRVGDAAARYGGEEFALLLVDTDDTAASVTAERIRALVEAFDWAQVMPGLHITVSIGVAGIHETTSTTAALNLADRRLYEAKSAGRNRVVGPREWNAELTAPADPGVAAFR
ncbi:MAG: GGDEF domain-containing protein [Actinoplanes sp.]